MNNAFHRTPSLSVARSRLNILIKNIESANVDVEEMVEDNEHMLKSRETFVRVLQVTIFYQPVTICIYFDIANYSLKKKKKKKKEKKILKPV